ncbi:YqzG/YhdC family protein [Bacillus sinesaloumensis]|uniref:YqzG/YhdC family protein n=1 Tax=Litchfieldia sinesaloumensis TaxID=1926280 RepID=UPI00115138C8|nr:YqzG/YhdC family protein [Bacillus sinesaloumensis]
MLRNILIGCCCFGLFLIPTIGLINESPIVTAEQKKPVPEYAKWGKLAMEKTKNKYPSAQIIDYLHVGRTKKNGMYIERFKLWLKQDNREFGVFVNITFEADTERVKNITIVETDR